LLKKFIKSSLKETETIIHIVKKGVSTTQTVYSTLERAWHGHKAAGLTVKAFNFIKLVTNGSCCLLGMSDTEREIGQIRAGPRSS
jgi:hypothetical protein